MHKRPSSSSSLLQESIDRRLWHSILFLLLVLTVGSFGYHYLEGMSLFDGLFQTFITITTIGFSELHEPHDSTRVLTMVIALTGIGTITYIGGQIVQQVFDSNLLLNRALQNKRRKMKQHYIICGYGRIGHRIAEVLIDSGIQIIVVENSESSIEELKKRGIAYVFGDASEDNTLFEAGIDRAKGLVCALSKDQDNIFTTLLARELNPEIFIMARTNETRNQRRILRAGADKVISPYEIGSDHMSNVLLRPKMVHFIDSLMARNKEDHLFDELTVMSGAPIIDKSLAQAKLRNSYGVAIIAMIPRDSNSVQFNPAGDDIIREGDTLIVLGDQKQVDHMRTEICKDKRKLEDRVLEYDYRNALDIKKIIP